MPQNSTKNEDNIRSKLSMQKSAIPFSDMNNERNLFVVLPTIEVSNGFVANNFIYFQNKVHN